MLKSRKYKSGDETQINALYQLLTGRKRDSDQYSWEWLKNPYDVNSKWVIFEKDGRIVGHHGLIPTPLYVFGETYLAGKTENTMLHPDYQGKHVYFPFERKFFEEAKEIYKILFTTTGQGAPGKIREKLGYNKLSHWDRFIYYKIQYDHIDPSDKIIKNTILNVIFVFYLSFLKTVNIFTNRKQVKNLEQYQFKISKTNNKIFEDIEKLWKKNKNFYTNTVDRNKKYLSWRIGKNPNHKHLIITLTKKNILLGYIILKPKDEKIVIEDILVEKNKKIYFEMLLKYLREWLKNTEYKSILCYLITQNKSIKEALSNNLFISKKTLLIKREKGQPFYINCLVNIDDKKNQEFYKEKNWYITGLVLEGL